MRPFLVIFHVLQPFKQTEPRAVLELIRAVLFALLSLPSIALLYVGIVDCTQSESCLGVVLLYLHIVAVVRHVHIQVHLLGRADW